jgi:general secretion pathway protein I
MKRSVSAGQNGFSLLELLVAFVIMAFSLGMLYQASGGTVRSIGDTEQQMRATVLAESLLNSRSNVAPDGWNETGESAGLSWRVNSAPYVTDADLAKAPALQRVTIVVGWSGRNGQRELELSTLLPQSKPAQGPPP